MAKYGQRSYTTEGIPPMCLHSWTTTKASLVRLAAGNVIKTMFSNNVWYLECSLFVIEYSS